MGRIVTLHEAGIEARFIRPVTNSDWLTEETAVAELYVEAGTSMEVALVSAELLERLLGMAGFTRVSE